MESHAHVSIPLTLQGILGFVAIWLIQSFSTIIVDSRWYRAALNLIAEIIFLQFFQILLELHLPQTT